MAALWRAAAFVAGVCLLQNQAALPPLAPSLWAVIILLLAAIAVRALRLSQEKIAAIGAFGLGFLLCFAVGFSWANWRAHDRLRPLLPTDLRWQDIVVEGRVDGLASIDRNAARFDFAIDKLVSPPRPLPAFKARISYRPHAGAIRLGEIRDGARLRLKVRIREPRSNFNPNGFDYAGWLFARKIRYGGYTRSGEENRLLAAGGGLRESLRARIAAAIPDSSARAIVAALAIGDRSGLSDSQWESMRRAGVVHLVSISAVHIGFVFGVAFLLCRLALLFLRRYFFVVKGQTVACLVALAAAGGYAALAGFQIPTQRALIMLAAGCAAALWGRRHSMLMPFSLALFAVVAFDPWAVLSPGFWLSFFLAGVILILIRQGFEARSTIFPAASEPPLPPSPPPPPPPVVYKRLPDEGVEVFLIVDGESIGGKLRYAAAVALFRLRALEWDRQIWPTLLSLATAGLLISILTTVAAAAFIFSFLIASLLLRGNIKRYFLFQILLAAGAIPLTFAFFGEGSIISPIANFFAVPAVGLALPFVLADVVLPGDFLWRAAAIPLAGFEWAIEKLSSPVWAAKFAPTPTPILFALAVGGALWLLTPVGRLRWFGALPLCALAFAPPIAIPQGDATVATLDVGQGSAIVVRTANRTLVYDAGPRRGKFDSGAEVVLPFLRGRGWQRIDALVVSHDDGDHSGGAESILRASPEADFYSSLPPAKARNLSAKAARCESGIGWRWDGIDFLFLHPSAADYRARREDNDMSCALLIRTRDSAALLTGDLSGEFEEELLARHPAVFADIRARRTILLASHHGSKNSSRPKFARAVAPQTAIFSAGLCNTHGHPHPAVTDLFAREIGAKIARTDRDGAVILHLGAPQKIQTQRPRDRRYWHIDLDRACGAAKNKAATARK